MPAESQPHRSSIDIIDLYKKDVDRTLLREQLRKTPDERVGARGPRTVAEELQRSVRRTRP